MAGEHLQDKMWESAVEAYDGQHRPQRHLRHWYMEKHKNTNGKAKQEIYSRQQNKCRSEENNAQGTKANAKAETQIADDIVGPHAAWTCAVQATGEERGLEAQKKDKRGSTCLSELACSIYL